MSGPSGVMAVILLETAVGGAVVLWAGGVWGKVRRGFFLLTGITLALCAAGAWALVAREVAGAAATAIGVFTGLLVLWQVLLAVRADAVSRLVGLAAALAGVVTLPLLAGATRDAGVARGVAELALGSVFLGTALYGLLLGHWYLVERRLDKGHMVKGAWFYVAGVVAAAAATVLAGFNPPPSDLSQVSPFLGTPNFTVLLAGGLVAICALIGAFAIKLANEGGRSIQAATGYFYLAVIMAFSAELASKFRFFT